MDEGETSVEEGISLFHSMPGMHVYLPLQPASIKHRASSAAETTDMWVPVTIGLRSSPDHRDVPRQATPPSDGVRKMMISHSQLSSADSLQTLGRGFWL